jgi:hypothetical protein
MIFTFLLIQFSKFPQITSGKKEISISTQPDEWIFPTSGVVFVY